MTLSNAWRLMNKPDGFGMTPLGVFAVRTEGLPQVKVDGSSHCRGVVSFENGCCKVGIDVV